MICEHLLPGSMQGVGGAALEKAEHGEEEMPRDAADNQFEPKRWATSG